MSKNLLHPVAFVMVVVVTTVVFLQIAQLQNAQSQRVIESIAVASVTVKQALEVRDWDFTLHHLNSLAVTGRIFDLSVTYVNGQALVGPLGQQGKFDFGKVCAQSTLEERKIVLQGCVSIAEQRDLITITVYLFLSAGLLYGSFEAARRTVNRLVNSISAMLKNVATAKPHDDLAIDELIYLRDEMVQLIKERGRREVVEGHFQLARQVAHDIRSPLQALNTIASSLVNVPENTKRMLNQTITRINDIATGLLDRSRASITQAGTNSISSSPYEGNVNTGQLKGVSEATPSGYLNPGGYDLAPHSAASLSESVFNECQLRFQQSPDLTLKFEIEDEAKDLAITADPSDIKRILSNLINNAAEALPKGGTIWLRLKERSPNLVFEIADNGIGIPDEILDQIGSKGFTYGKASGNGLGLYHAKTCLAKFGGSLKIESRQNAGTRVSIYLPIHQTPTTPI